MLSIVSSYFNDGELAGYWNELIHNHPDVEFIFVDDFSQEQRVEDHMTRTENVKLFRVTEDKWFNSHGARNLGVSQASNQTVFMTDMDALPTETAMEHLKLITTKDQEVMFWPVWDEWMPNPYAGTKCPNEFTVRKDQFIAIKGYDEEVANQPNGWFGDWWTRRNYLNTYQPVIAHSASLYFLEEYNGDRAGHKVRDRELEARIKAVVDDRNRRQDYSKKPWLNFTWERLL